MGCRVEPTVTVTRLPSCSMTGTCFSVAESAVFGTISVTSSPQQTALTPEGWT